jgi:hypothetical protein
MGDLACLIIVLAAAAITGAVLLLLWIQGQGKESTGSRGSGPRDLDADPYTGVPYGAMDDQMDDW